MQFLCHHFENLITDVITPNISTENVLSPFYSENAQNFQLPHCTWFLLVCNLIMQFLCLFFLFLFQLQLGILNPFVLGSLTRKMVKDTKIKGTIKYVLFFNCFTGTLCISLRSTHSPRRHKMILEGTLCLISSPGWSPVQPGLYSTLEGSLMVPLSSYLLEDMGLNPGDRSGV